MASTWSLWFDVQQVYSILQRYNVLFICYQTGITKVHNRKQDTSMNVMAFPSQHLQILDREVTFVIIHVKGIVLEVAVLVMYQASTNAIGHGALIFKVDIQTPFPIKLSSRF